MTRYCHECNEHLNPCEDELCDLCNGLDKHGDDCKECYRPRDLEMKEGVI